MIYAAGWANARQVTVLNYKCRKDRMHGVVSLSNSGKFKPTWNNRSQMNGRMGMGGGCQSKLSQKQSLGRKEKPTGIFYPGFLIRPRSWWTGDLGA